MCFLGCAFLDAPVDARQAYGLMRLSKGACFYCAARMVSTGTATDAVTIAAVTNAARALMISSLMKSLLLGNTITFSDICYRWRCAPE